MHKHRHTYKNNKKTNKKQNKEKGSPLPGKGKPFHSCFFIDKSLAMSLLHCDIKPM